MYARTAGVLAVHKHTLHHAQGSLTTPAAQADVPVVCPRAKRSRRCAAPTLHPWADMLAPTGVPATDSATMPAATTLPRNAVGGTAGALHVAGCSAGTSAALDDAEQSGCPARSAGNSLVAPPADSEVPDMKTAMPAGMCPGSPGCAATAGGIPGDATTGGGNGSGADSSDEVCAVSLFVSQYGKFSYFILSVNAENIHKHEQELTACFSP